MIRTANIEVSLQRLSILRIEHPQANPLKLACTLRAGETLPSGLTVTAEIHTSRNVAAETAPLASTTVSVAADATSFEVTFDSPQTNQTVTPNSVRACWLVLYGVGDADRLYTLAAADLLLGWHAVSRLTADPPATSILIEKGGVAWAAGRSYVTGTVVTVGTTAYICTADNLSTVDDEPGVGMEWESFWVLFSGGGGDTNLSATVSPTQVVINSDTGTDATIPAADGTNAGVMLPAQVTKLAGIAAGATKNNIIHLFCLSGQSNSYGAGGNAAQAPTPMAGAYQWTSSGGVQALTLTTGTSGGQTLGTSCAAAFANAYISVTGLQVGIVAGVMIDGAAQSSLADGGNGNFDVSGALRATVVSRYLAAKAAFEAAGYQVVMAGIIWLQGEQDAIYINSGTITQAQYQTALTTMLAYYRTNIDTNLPLWLVRTGVRTSASDVGSAAVRGAQENVAAADNKTLIAYRDTDTFSARSMLADTVHYNQAGQNEVGARVGLFAAGIEPREPVALKGSTTTIPVTADNQVVQTHSGYVRLSSDSATASNRSIVLTAPLKTGQLLFLENVQSAFFVQLLNGQANSSGSGVCFLNRDWSALGQKDSITLISDGVNWIELSRSGGFSRIQNTSAALSSFTSNGLTPLIASTTTASTIVGENTASSGALGGAFFAVFSNDGAAMAANDRLGGMSIGGSSSSSSLRVSVGIRAFATENWIDGSAYGSGVGMLTTPNGTTTPVVSVWTSDNGNTGIGSNVFSSSSQPTARLQVRGAGTSTGVGLLVENSSGTARFTVRDDGAFAFAGGTVAVAETGWTTFTNITTDRTCDANATTVEELADILGTLIVALKNKGILAN
jgi:hypothetical protein